nr:hypothetical protein [Tanacetum cinerariifolium]
MAVGLGGICSGHGRGPICAENTNSGKLKLTENNPENWAGAGFLWERVGKVVGSVGNGGEVETSGEEGDAGLAGELGDEQ